MINCKIHNAHTVKNKIESITDYHRVIIYSRHEPSNVKEMLNPDAVPPIADYSRW